MKIKQTNNHKNRNSIIVIIVLLAVVAAVTFFWYRNNNTLDSSDQNQMAPISDSKSKDPVDSNSKTTDNGDTMPTQPSTKNGDDTNTNVADTTLTITSANQNNNVLQIRTLISSIWSNGTCTLTLSKEGYNTVTKTAGVQSLASDSTCKGFDIPTSELGAGVWSAKISATNGTDTVSSTKEVTIK